MNNNRIRFSLAALCMGLALGATSVQAQQNPPYSGYGPGWGMGPGMMGGYGPGYGMGPGMMGGYGPGYGMGPGMMGGYGPGYGMGPGMMGGYGPGYGMGPGMMGGYGPGYGMGPGMMGGYGPGAGFGALNLSDSQAAQLEKVQNNLWEKHRKIMSEMWQQQAKLAQLYSADKPDASAIGKVQEKIAKLQSEALEARVEADNKISDILTKEQKSQLRRGYGWGMMGY